MITDHSLVFAAAALLVAVLAWSRPGWALVPLLVGLPLFAHHPITPLAHWLVALVAVLQVVYVVRVRPSWAEARTAVSSQPLLLLGALFVAAALLSLSSLPLSGMWHEYRAASPATSLAEWPRLVQGWMRLTETRREFSPISALLTLQGFLLALIVWRETRASSTAAVRYSAAVTLGMVVFILLGLFEVFGGASLEFLRGTTQVMIREGTLQSTAGNPGWFSQYLVYALPHALVILAGTSALRVRIAWTAGVTALTALALAACFQRGGWIAGAVVVFYMAVAGLRLSTPAAGAGAVGRRDVWRALAAVAVIVALVAGGFSLWLARAGPRASEFGAGAYLTRLKSIAAADRLSYLAVGSRIAALHPVLGGGHESFAYLYQRYVEQPGGPYHRSPLRLGEAASAHSVYFQTMTGTGLVGLALLVGMFVVAAMSAVRALQSPAADRARRVAVLAGCGSLLGVACYGLVQEVFYVHALRLLFFVAVGIVAGLTHDQWRWPRRTARVLWMALAAAFAVHLGYEYGWPGPERLLRSGEPTGLYAEEVGSRDVRFQWSSEWSTWPVPAGATAYSLQVGSLAPFPQQVEVEMCGGDRTRVTLRDHGWHQIDGRVEGCAPGTHLQLRVTPGWRPPGDARLLGVMTTDVRVD